MKMTLKHFFGVSILFLFSLAVSAQKIIQFSLNEPPSVPSLLGKNTISTAMNERDFALSPDGKEIFYTISTPKSSFQTIVYSKKVKEGEWTQPEVAFFAGEFSDIEPAFSADGNTLYFSSNRPVTGNTPGDFNIWMITRSGNTWGKPENMGALINTAADEFYPSVGKSGNLYFTAAYPGGVGKEDIYMAAWTVSGYQKPMPLDTSVNSTFYEFNAFVSPDEKYILFTSYGRRDDAGGGDMYISVKDEKGKWQPAKNLKALNSKQLDYCPFVSPDGKILFFTSERHQLPAAFAGSKASYKKVNDIFNNPLNGTGNIYWIDFKKVLETVNR